VPQFPPCWDNNQTVNALSDCYDTLGNTYAHCVQVAYSSNAFIPQCREDDEPSSHCGTYLEIHRLGGSPYFGLFVCASVSACIVCLRSHLCRADEVTILSDVNLDVLNVSGYNSTRISLQYMNESNKVKCSRMQ
jgi:hypothetical protein